MKKTILTPEQEKFLRDHAGQDMTVRQIADHLSININTLRGVMRRMGVSASRRIKIGTVYRRKDGYHVVKTGSGKHDFEYAHKYFWQKKYGPVPKGYQLVNVSGDSSNYDPENWKLMSHAERMKIASSSPLQKKNAAEGLKKLYDRERLRLKYGLRPKTKYNLKNIY